LGAEEVSQQRQTLTDGVTKVDSNATVPNGASNDTANNTATSPNATITTISSPDTTTVNTTTAALQPANVSLSSRLGTENIPNGSPEIVSTTVETPTNTDPSGDIPSSVNNTILAPISVSPGTVSNNTITGAPIDTNVSSTSQPDITETVITLMSTSVDNSPNTPSSTELISDDVQFTEQPVDTSTAIASTEMTLVVETTNTSTPMLVSQNLQISPEVTTLSATNNASENIGINTVQQIDEATTDTPINNLFENIAANTEQSDLEIYQTAGKSTTEVNNIIENIEALYNTIQQSDTAIASQITEAMSTTELSTTEISNDIIQTQTTEIPSTFRTRLIDFAEDILSHLQSDLTTETPITVTTSSSELFNAIPDSSSTSTESPARIQGTTIVQEVRNTETTTSQLEATTDRNIDVGSIETTTAVTAQDESSQQMTIQNIVGLDTSDPSVEQRLSSNVERNATLNSDLMTMTTQDTRSLGDSPIDAEVATTTSMPNSRFVDFVTENDPSSSSNDTLLTELMTIAKTLFSEAMNDTRQSSLVSSQISDLDTTTLPDVSNLSRANGENNDKNQVTSSSDTSERTTASSAFFIPLESITGYMNTVTPVDLPESKTEKNSNRASIVESEISLMKFNMRPTDAESPNNVDDVTVTPQMSRSQIKIETPNTITSISMNFELTTNTPDLQLSNPIQLTNNIEQRNTSAIDSTQNQFTILPNNNVEFTTLDSVTNNSSIMNPANTTEMPADLNQSTNISVETGLTTSVDIMEINVQMNNTNQATGSTMIKPTSDTTNKQFLVTNAPSIITTLPIAFDATDTSNAQLFNTEPPTTESVHNLISSIETTTNQFNDITTNVPQMITINETSNLIARFQDTTTATTTAQGTAGSSIVQPEQTIETTTIPTATAFSTTPMPTISPTSSESFIIDTTTIQSPSVETTAATATTTTETTTTMTTTTTTTAIPETIRLSSQANFTAGSMSETSTLAIDINENLVSTETSTDISTTRGTTVIPSEADDLNMISRMDVGEEMPMTTTVMSTTAPVTTTTSTTTSTAPTASTIIPVPMNTSTAPTITSTTQNTMNRITSPTFARVFNTVPYFGRLGGSQLPAQTPTPRPNSPSRAPIRDYLIYGIYPNKTIVRKRPEDNLIDPRNVDSPYVIFGIYPDGRLVRKYPNGTIIPDSARNPVEVVFTLSTTTTTNRPALRPIYNQANQAVTYNQYQAPIYYNNRRPSDELTRGGQNPSPIDFGLTGNAIGVSPGIGPIFAGPFGSPASALSTNKMVSLFKLFIKIIFYPRNEFNRESFN